MIIQALEYGILIWGFCVCAYSWNGSLYTSPCCLISDAAPQGGTHRAEHGGQRLCHSSLMCPYIPLNFRQPNSKSIENLAALVYAALPIMSH